MVRAWRNSISSISSLGLESRSASSQIAIPDLLATLLKQFAKQQAYNRTSVPLSTLVPMAEFAHNSWKHEHTKHTPHELITGANPTASINTPEDSVPAAQERLKQLQESRSDAQKALQKRIKPLRLTKSFNPGDKVWLDARNLRIKAPSRK